MLLLYYTGKSYLFNYIQINLTATHWQKESMTTDGTFTVLWLEKQVSFIPTHTQTNIHLRVFFVVEETAFTTALSAPTSTFLVIILFLHFKKFMHIK